jgi:hypothetical protein
LKHMHPLYEDERAEGVRLEVYARDGEACALLERAEALRAEIGYRGTVVEMLDDAMALFQAAHAIVRVERARTAYKATRDAKATDTRPTATERRVEAQKSGNRYAGAQPAYQSRGALGPRNPGGAYRPV